MKTVIFDGHPSRRFCETPKATRFPSGGLGIIRNNVTPEVGDIVLDPSSRCREALERIGLKIGDFVGGCAYRITNGKLAGRD